MGLDFAEVLSWRSKKVENKTLYLVRELTPSGARQLGASQSWLSILKRVPGALDRYAHFYLLTYGGKSLEPYVRFSFEISEAGDRPPLLTTFSSSRVETHGTTRGHARNAAFRQGSPRARRSANRGPKGPACYPCVTRPRPKVEAWSAPD